ncbi:hypothetical protein DI272_28515 [Streptomyces sp. Act143]|uniref:hypothetical protein n=1 Tax=Streptomyces sp. Act143 TaxID=2200760 RepID=UPI000D67E8D1|nr:hypothetical protein [Streptomyces sp. Act143]PWI17668.1 hypothetical protein DI272_28515 [Streptomyces sp. Act143]
MARQASPSTPTAQRALAALATAGVALGAGAASAAADTQPVADELVRTRPTSLGQIDPQAGLQSITGTVGYVTGPVAGLKPNPLAGTGVDPLDNGLGTQVADFQPVATQMLTAPVAQAQSIGGMPVIGQVTGLLGNG